MKFEIGKVYKHSSGQIMAIVGKVNTTGYGECLVGECFDMVNLKPIGMDEDATQGWEEIEMTLWDEAWKKNNP